jgi:predicted nucleic acid-binding protein
MFVLDCSVTMAWAFRDESTPATLALLDRTAEEPVAVPGIWPLEVCNAVLVALRRGRFTDEDVPGFLDLVTALSLGVDTQAEGRIFDEVLPLARRHGLSSYDAAYLELALRKKAPLATLDAGLARAARAAGVEVLGDA